MSIVSISYNQEEYIREALDGFAAQRTEFPVEVIIADDASTDATPRIIGEYAARYPQLFRPILRQTNIGVHANFKDVLSAARGEYLALCEGDDYWTDPLKLSKQVKYLDRHPETTVCFHPVRVIYEDGAKDSEFPPLSWRRDLSVDALLARNFIQTNSVVYRRQPSYDDIPANVMHIPHHPQLGGRSYGYYVIVQSSGHDRLLDGVASEDGNQNEHIWTEPSWSRPVAVPIQEG